LRGAKEGEEGVVVWILMGVFLRVGRVKIGGREGGGEWWGVAGGVGLVGREGLVFLRWVGG